MKKMLAILMLVVCIIVSIAGISFADDMKFVTIQEWLDAKGDVTLSSEKHIPLAECKVACHQMPSDFLISSTLALARVTHPA